MMSKGASWDPLESGSKPFFHYESRLIIAHSILYLLKLENSKNSYILKWFFSKNLNKVHYDLLFNIQNVTCVNTLQ